MLRNLPALALFAAFAAAVTLTAADGPKTPDLQTKKVVVFKDGYCLFIKQGSATTDAHAEFYTDQVPDAAVLGSFWALPEEGRLVSLRSGWETVSSQLTKEVPCTGYLDVLLANHGKKVRLEMTDNNFVSGVIHKVITTPTNETLTPAAADIFGIPRDAIAGTPEHSLATSLPSGLQPPTTSRITNYIVSGVSGTQFILRREDGDMLLNAAAIKSMTIEEMQNTLPRTLTTIERTKRLTFRFDEPEKPRSLNLLYFRPGLRWIPTYRVNLSSDPKVKTAQIALQAEILNEAERLEEVPMDIVVGVPNFRFRSLPSPLILEQVLRNTLVQAAPQLMGNFRNDLSNALYTQRSGEFRREAAQANVGGGEQIELPNELTASGAQDLFVYNLPKLSLDTGERIAVNIFNADKVPYRDIYTWDLRVTRDDIEAAPSGSGVQSPLKLSSNEVWHQVELTNNTNLPWTTGAAMLMQQQQPLAQELLTYTSPKDVCRVPVTVSVETRGSLEEEEAGRELNALKWDGYTYARIEKEASLHLCNNKAEPIDVEITLRLGGKVTEASQEGKVALNPWDATDWNNYRGHPAVNNSSTVRWKVKLAAGETFEPTVKYYYFARQ